MRRTSVWLVAVAAMTWACGPDQGLPADPGLPGGQPPPVEIPENQNSEQVVEKSLWPLTAQSRWTYRITDPARPAPFDKVVQVEGEQDIPDMAGARAVAVRSTQPHLEELSFQVVNGGVVFRIREQDMKDGQLVRAMTWNPLVMKAIAAEQTAGWTHSETVIEVERDANGVVVSEKEKVFVWTVEAVNEAVTVGAGTFPNAIKLRRERADKDDWARVYWLVPGVGKVLEEGERREELMAYDVRT